MKLSEILESLTPKKRGKSVKVVKKLMTWNPKLWIPEPMKLPVTVHILSHKDFETVAESHGFKKRIGAFSVWGKDLEGNPVNLIYMRYNKLHLFSHEIRHLQQGHFHD